MVLSERLRLVRRVVAPLILGGGPLSLPGESLPDVESGVEGIGVVWPEHLFPVGDQLPVALFRLGPTALPTNAPVGHAPGVQPENECVVTFGPLSAPAVTQQPDNLSQSMLSFCPPAQASQGPGELLAGAQRVKACGAVPAAQLDGQDVLEIFCCLLHAALLSACPGMHVPQAKVGILIMTSQVVGESHGPERELLGTPFSLTPQMRRDAAHHAVQEVPPSPRGEMGGGVEQQLLYMRGEEAEVCPVLGAPGVQSAGESAGRNGGASTDQRGVWPFG